MAFHLVAFFFVTFAIFKFVIESLSFAMIRFPPLACLILGGISVAATQKQWNLQKLSDGAVGIKHFKCSCWMTNVTLGVEKSSGKTWRKG